VEKNRISLIARNPIFSKNRISLVVRNPIFSKNRISLVARNPIFSVYLGPEVLRDRISLLRLSFQKTITTGITYNKG
jgi:hypothetical protein